MRESFFTYRVKSNATLHLFFLSARKLLSYEEELKGIGNDVFMIRVVTKQQQQQLLYAGVE